jgi:hypothetical protein
VTRVSTDVLIGAILIFLAWCSAMALAGEPAIGDELNPPVYRVQAPTTGAVTDAPAASTVPTTPARVVASPVSVVEVASVSAYAERGTAVQVAPTVPPPAPTGLHGLPLAPAGLSACSTAAFYRAQAGLPERFDGIIWRESRCQPGASNWCCSGLSQIHKLWVPKLAGCDVYVRDDLYDPQRNLCAASYVLAVQGIDAWSTA